MCHWENKFIFKTTKLSVCFTWNRTPFLSFSTGILLSTFDFNPTGILVAWSETKYHWTFKMWHILFHRKQIQYRVKVTIKNLICLSWFEQNVLSSLKKHSRCLWDIKMFAFLWWILKSDKIFSGWTYHVFCKWSLLTWSCCNRLPGIVSLKFQCSSVTWKKWN